MRHMIGKVDPERLRHDLFYLSKAPLPFRKVNYTRPGQEKSTLDETDDFIEQQLAAIGYTVHKTAHPVQPFRCDSTKPLHHWYAKPADDDPWYEAFNIEAERVGTERPDEIIVLVAHKDSQYHLEGDVPERVDLDNLRRSVQLVLAVVLEMDQQG